MQTPSRVSVIFLLLALYATSVAAQQTALNLEDQTLVVNGTTTFHSSSIHLKNSQLAINLTALLLKAVESTTSATEIAKVSVDLQNVNATEQSGLYFLLDLQYGIPHLRGPSQRVVVDIEVTGGTFHNSWLFIPKLYGLNHDANSDDGGAVELSLQISSISFVWEEAPSMRYFDVSTTPPAGFRVERSKAGQLKTGTGMAIGLGDVACGASSTSTTTSTFSLRFSQVDTMCNQYSESPLYTYYTPSYCFGALIVSGEFTFGGGSSLVLSNSNSRTQHMRATASIAFFEFKGMSRLHDASSLRILDNKGHFHIRQMKTGYATVKGICLTQSGKNDQLTITNSSSISVSGNSVTTEEVAGATPRNFYGVAVHVPGIIIDSSSLVITGNFFKGVSTYLTSLIHSTTSTLHVMNQSQYLFSRNRGIALENTSAQVMGFSVENFEIIKIEGYSSFGFVANNLKTGAEKVRSSNTHLYIRSSSLTLNGARGSKLQVSSGSTLQVAQNEIVSASRHQSIGPITFFSLAIQIENSGTIEVSGNHLTSKVDSGVSVTGLTFDERLGFTVSPGGSFTALNNTVVIVRNDMSKNAHNVFLCVQFPKTIKMTGFDADPSATTFLFINNTCMTPAIPGAGGTFMRGPTSWALSAATVEIVENTYQSDKAVRNCTGIVVGQITASRSTFKLSRNTVVAHSQENAESIRFSRPLRIEDHSSVEVHGNVLTSQTFSKHGVISVGIASSAGGLMLKTNSLVSFDGNHITVEQGMERYGMALDFPADVEDGSAVSYVKTLYPVEKVAMTTPTTKQLVLS